MHSPPPIRSRPLTGINGGPDEAGLLGIAVDPGWPARPYVYTHATATSGFVRISRYTVTGDLSNTGNGSLSISTSSRYDLINDIPDDAGNHNGGSVRFGPDGMLYVSLGEDADPCAAQDTTLKGVILRLDVANLPAGSGGPPPGDLITPSDNPFATTVGWMRASSILGLRNPYRIHIDPQNGAVFIADVGQSQWEEIDRADVGGRNFGWPVREGPNSYSSMCPTSYPLTIRSPGTTGPARTAPR